jgi:hypothetical protein
MSEQKLEILRRAYEAVSAHGEPPRELFVDDAEFDATGAAPDIGLVRSWQAHVVKFRADKIASWSTYTDREQAIEAAGLRE